MFINTSTKEFTIENNAIPSYDIAFEHLLLIVLTKAPQRSLIRNNRARDTDTMDIIFTIILIL